MSGSHRDAAVARIQTALPVGAKAMGGDAGLINVIAVLGSIS